MCIIIDIESLHEGLSVTACTRPQGAQGQEPGAAAAVATTTGSTNSATNRSGGGDGGGFATKSPEDKKQVPSPSRLQNGL